MYKPPQDAKQNEMLKRFRTALDSRYQRLSENVLQNYIHSCLEKRSIFLKSVKTFGAPHYFFDQPALNSAIQTFKNTFSQHLKTVRIFYAMKSNSHSGVCRAVRDAGLGIDVSSGQELGMALDLGFETIIFSGPGKTDDELRLAIKNSGRVTILMDSRGEYERICRLASKRKTGGALTAGLRISPEPGTSWRKFGVPFAEAVSIMKTAAKGENVKIEGLQFHKSWNLSPDAHVEMINRIGAFVTTRLPGHLAGMIRFLDIGGGFWPESGEWLNPENTPKGNLLRLLDPDYSFDPVFYLQKAKPLAHFAKAVSTAVSRQGPPLSKAEIWTEPGRWLSNSSMHILLRVIDIKGGNVAITDGGTNLLGWERPLTEFIPLINLTRPALKAIRFNVYGSLCTPLDIWGSRVFGKNVLPGDVLLVPDQGAYTYSLRQSFIKPVAGVVKFDGKEVTIDRASSSGIFFPQHK